MSPYSIPVKANSCRSDFAFTKGTPGGGKGVGRERRSGRDRSNSPGR